MKRVLIVVILLCLFSSCTPPPSLNDDNQSFQIGDTVEVLVASGNQMVWVNGVVLSTSPTAGYLVKYSLNGVLRKGWISRAVKK